MDCKKKHIRHATKEPIGTDFLLCGFNHLAKKGLCPSEYSSHSTFRSDEGASIPFFR